MPTHALPIGLMLSALLGAMVWAIRQLGGVNPDWRDAAQPLKPREPNPGLPTDQEAFLKLSQTDYESLLHREREQGREC